MPQVLVRPARDPARPLCPTPTDRLLSPLLKIKIGRYAKCLFHYVCVLILGRQLLQYMLVTNAVYRGLHKCNYVYHRGLAPAGDNRRSCLQNVAPPFVPCLNKARWWVREEDGM
jgi:hypothetical protein